MKLRAVFLNRISRFQPRAANFQGRQFAFALNSLSLLCMEANTTKTLSYEDIINEFAIEKSRKKAMLI